MKQILESTQELQGGQSPGLRASLEIVQLVALREGVGRDLSKGCPASQGPAFMLGVLPLVPAHDVLQLCGSRACTPPWTCWSVGCGKAGPGPSIIQDESQAVRCVRSDLLSLTRSFSNLE